MMQPKAVPSTSYLGGNGGPHAQAQVVCYTNASQLEDTRSAGSRSRASDFADAVALGLLLSMDKNFPRGTLCRMDSAEGSKFGR